MVTLPLAIYKEVVGEIIRWNEIFGNRELQFGNA